MVIWGNPAAVIGGLIGREIGRDIAAESPDLPSDAPRLPGFIKDTFGFWIYVSIVFAVLVVGTIGILIGDSIGIDLAGVVAALLVFGPIVPVFHGHYLAWNDRKALQRARENVGDPVYQRATEVYSLSTHRQPATRQYATQAMASLCVESPGKFVKYVSDDVASVTSTIAARLADQSTQTTVASLRSLRWLARDYPQAVLSHVEMVAEFTQTTQSPLQVEAILLLGTVAPHDSDRHEGYLNAIGTGISDPDAEVRHATATALGNLRTQSSFKLLGELATDSNPEVRQQAQEMRKLLATQHGS